MSVATTLITEKFAELHKACQRHHVKRLELFGSAATGGFDLARSDLDFLVEFVELSPVERADAYFNLLASLQDLYERDVDLVEVDAIDNRYFRQTIDQGRTVLYAA